MNGEQMPQNKERVALISFESYLDTLHNIDSMDGEIPADVVHVFYIWLARQVKLQDIDGYSILEIYKKNVMETGMKYQRFFQWCRDFNFPVPLDEQENVTDDGEKFNLWFEAETEMKNLQYAQWADKNKIDTSEGSVMRFIDTNGDAHYVCTDFDHRGEIVVS